MHTLIAFIAPVFTAIFHPVMGDELVWTQKFESSPVLLELNNDPTCTVALGEDEAAMIVEAIVDVVDNDAPGKTVSLRSGGEITMLNGGNGDVRLTTNPLPTCTTTLLADHDEPEKILEIFTAVAD